MTTRLTGVLAGMLLLAFSTTLVHAIPLTMSFSINITDPGSGVIQYETDGITPGIDTITHVDLDIGGNTYELDDLTFENLGDESTIDGGDFQLTFNNQTGEAGSYCYGQTCEGSFTITQVAAPATLALLGLGLAMLGVAVRRKI